jgi:hypothetical protein
MRRPPHDSRSDATSASYAAASEVVRTKPTPFSECADDAQQATGGGWLAARDGNPRRSLEALPEV